MRGTFAALVAAVLCGCGSEPDFVTVDGTMLGTTLHVVADVKGVSRQRLYAAVMELDREAKASMSIYDSTSLASPAGSASKTRTSIRSSNSWAAKRSVSREGGW